MPVYDYLGNPIVSGGSDWVNVKNYGAVGDGVTDDSSAIQSAFDSVRNGGILYFPVSTYNINSSIIFYSNQTIIFDKGAVVRSGSSSLNNLFRSYCDSSITAYNGTHDVAIFGMCLDGGAYQLNNTLLAMVHCKNILIANSAFLNGMVGYHNIEVNAASNVRITNCRFTRGSRLTDSGEMIQLDIPGSATYPWDSVNADGTNCRYIEIDSCYFSDNDTSPAIGRHNGTPQYVRIHDNVFDGLISTRGAIALAANNVDVYNNTFVDCTYGMTEDTSTFYVHDNRFINVTTVATNGMVHNNIINGTYTA